MAKRQPTEEEKRRGKLGIRARQDAVDTLIDRYRTEFEEMHAKNRIAVGLPPQSGQPRQTKQQLEERVRKQREKLEKWVKELERLEGLEETG